MNKSFWELNPTKLEDITTLMGGINKAIYGIDPFAPKEKSEEQEAYDASFKDDIKTEDIMEGFGDYKLNQ